MANRTFVSFDWAIKKILRDKENFTVLEGFLSEIKPDFKAKGMERAKEVLRYENMPQPEKYAYDRTSRTS